MQNCLIVLGMHRSGTSALAGALRLLGVELGDRLMPPAPDNEAGFFEHREIFALHETLLRDLGRTWDDLRSLDTTTVPEGRARDFGDRLSQLLERNFAESALWAVKDPRLCRLLPLWNQTLATLECRPRALLIHRRPVDVAESLRARDGFSREKSGALWLDHCLAAERSTRGMPRVIVSYERLLDEPVEVLEKCASVLGIDWPTPPGEAHADLVGFLSKKLQHHRSEDGQLGSGFGRFTASVAPLHAALERADLTDGKQIAAEMDRLGVALSESGAGLDPLLLEHLSQTSLRAASGELWRLKTEFTAALSDASAQFEPLEELIQKVSHRVDGLAEELGRHSEEIRGQGEALSQGREQDARQQAAAQQALDFQRGSLEEMHASLQRLQASLESMRGHLERLDTQIRTILTSRPWRLYSRLTRAKPEREPRPTD